VKGLNMTLDRRWDIEKFGRVKVMLMLIEQATGDWSWERHNELLETLPWSEEKKAGVFPIALERLGSTKVRIILNKTLSSCKEIIARANEKLRPEQYCCDQCTESIKNEIVIIQDRIDYINECLEKIKYQITIVMRGKRFEVTEW
jgi:hypothetical protein